jgi:hypothetical protein
MNSQFFCSEEHAAADRRSGRRVDGHYLTLAQSALSTRYAQGALFEFPI